MELVRQALLFLHFIGLASLLGGYLTQLRSKHWRVVTAMVHGALTQLVTGIALVGVLQATHRPVDNAKFAVKLLVLLVILVLVWLNRSKERASMAAFQAIGLLTVLNIGIAVFWR